jgi:hypothetical protein
MYSYCEKFNSLCVNTLGSFECKCKVGFRNVSSSRFQTKHACIDIDECNEQSLVCGANYNTQCINTLGSYECKCSIGYEWSHSARGCLDVNECVLSSNGLPLPGGQLECDEHSVCVNTNGSFNCLCKSGWNNAGRNYCSGF